MHISYFITDLEAQFLSLSSKKLTSAVPVFSAVKCINPDAAKGQSFGYSSLEFDTEIQHGIFDLKTGIFTVKTPGFYQFNFSAHVKFCSSSQYGKKQHTRNRIELCVDGEAKAGSYSCRPPLTSSSDLYYQPVCISAHLLLKFGEKVGVYITEGKTTDWPPSYPTRFSAILLAPK